MRSLLISLFLLALAGCGPRAPAVPVVPGADAVLGARLIGQFQCGACHTIPGIPAAQGRSAVTLAQFGQRSYIAGSIPNYPEQLARWIAEPAAMKPGTRMPAMGVSAAEARHMAAYLGTLQ